MDTSIGIRPAKGCIFFDWSGTLAYPKTRSYFAREQDPEKQLSTLKKGALEFLEKLHNNGFRMGLISNTGIDPKLFRDSIKRSGLGKYFPNKRIFLSSEYCKKPCEEIFTEAREVCGIQPIMVGDNYKHDIVPARKFGFEALYVKKYNPYMALEIKY